MDLQQLQIERKPRPVRRRRGGSWWLRGAGVLVLLALGWVFGPSLLTLSERWRLPEVRTMVVRAPAAAAAAAIRGTAANGHIVAARRAALSSDVPGRIVELRVTEGSVVKRGDIVARLYSDEYRAALEHARADHAVALAGVERARHAAAAAAAEAEQQREAAQAQHALLTEAQAQESWAAAELLRVSDLVRSGIGSPRDLDKAQSDRDAAAARVQSLAAGQRSATAATTTALKRAMVAESELAVAEAQAVAASANVQQAQATLDKTDVRAPFDGVVVLKDAEVGEVVSPNVQSGGNTRGAVCTMVDFDSLEVQANVAESSLAAVQVGASADVFLDILPDQRLPGRVDRIWPTADRQKATVEVRVVLLQRSEVLRPELGVRVVFHGGDAGAAEPAVPAGGAGLLVVPEEALVDAKGRTFAFVVERDTVRFVELRVGERKGGRAAVESGLRAGQVLVLKPPASLGDGDRIRLADG